MQPMKLGKHLLATVFPIQREINFGVIARRLNFPEISSIFDRLVLKRFIESFDGEFSMHRGQIFNIYEIIAEKHS
jgi:hypothetical protein